MRPPSAEAVYSDFHLLGQISTECFHLRILGFPKAQWAEYGSTVSYALQSPCNIASSTNIHRVRIHNILIEVFQSH